MTKRSYIVCISDDSLRLIGPFDDMKAASTWAVTPNEYGESDSVPATNNPTDNPRWQIIELDDDAHGWVGKFEDEFVIKLHLPNDGPMPP